ncbi:uncharacterized protein LOC131248619 [Magnolia sinica]|uniref:uncharacterized protein LOC131248619 n=1 Tax=Magnolia sinica TaxID=86752 RepID=UPI00265B4EF9|nr:uncharacterized protein LOC131248619 [Magnolia sinica]
MLAAWPPTRLPLCPMQKKTLPHRALVVVYAKIRRRRRPSPQIQYDDDESEEVGDLGLTLLTALKSETRLEEESLLEVRRSDSSRREEKKAGASLKGSDVLFALQKAAVQKATSRKGKKGMKGKPSREGRAEDSVGDYSDVRPLHIRSDWGVRLDEMETMLEELLNEEERLR